MLISNLYHIYTQIYQHNPASRGTIDQYWIKTNKGLFEVTCNMKLKCGGVEGVWMQVVDVGITVAQDHGRRLPIPGGCAWDFHLMDVLQLIFMCRELVMTISVDKLKLITKDQLMHFSTKHNLLMDT